ncbi:phage terminase small subunit P27 family [Enterobacter cloacae complex sp. CDL013]
MSGPPKTPTHLRLVRGNPSKRPINENEPKPPSGVPPTPKHFDKQGKYWFKRMADELDAIGVMSQLDARALELLVEAYTEYRHHCDTLEVEGYTYCIYKARVTVGTSGWVTPTIAGFDRSKYLVCCKWSSPYTLDYDGNRLLFLNDGSNTEDQPMSGTVDVVIFSGGVSPVAANPGFNIYNAAGQCTFSTARRPFVYLGVNFVPSTTAQTVPGGGYVPVGRFGLRVPSFGGGRIYHYHYGLVMQNGTLRVGRGVYVGWADRQLANAGVTPISLPVIPDMYV